MPRLPNGRFPVAGPSVSPLELVYVAQAAEWDWFDGPESFVARLESAFAQHTGRRWAMALPSCTSAIHLALAAAGIGPGDEVIVPETTWIASVAPACYLGASPVFVDISPTDWCVAIDEVERAITERTRAIVAVDLYGSIPDYARLTALAEEHDLFLVEDAAQALGSEREGTMAGGFGDAAVFSFHRTKILSTGEGGMVVTDDDQLFERIGLLRDHGRRPGDTDFLNVEVAYKYRMSSLQAAFGVAQYERLPELLQQKRAIFEAYQEGLADLDALDLMTTSPPVRSSRWMTTVVAADGLDVAGVRRELGAAGVDTRPVFHPLSSLPAFRDHRQAASGPDRPVAAARHARGFHLPSAYSIDPADVREICALVRGAVGAVTA